MKIEIAKSSEISKIVNFLQLMQEELGEHPLDIEELTQNIKRNDGDLTWFLFYDDAGILFGTMFAQPRFAYWKSQPDYYVGGVYILPEFRGHGYYRQIMNWVGEWAKNNNASRLVAMVSHQNEHSKNALLAMGWSESDYMELIKNL